MVWEVPNNVDEAELGRAVGEITISYSVRELLQRLEERQIRMETRTETTATKADLQALSDKVDALESVRDKMVGAAVVFGAFAGGGAGWLAQVLTHKG